MNTTNKLVELAEKRVILQSRIDQQRQTISLQAQTIRPVLELMDRGRGILNYLKEHPAPLAAAVTAAVVLRPRRLLTWSRRAWMGWKLWRGLRQRLDTVLSR